MRGESHFDILKEGTDIPSVAKNWHRHVVPHIERKIRELDQLIVDLHPLNEGRQFDCTLEELKSERRLLTRGLTKFMMQWPAPTVEVISDRHDPCSIPPHWWELPLSQGLPPNPLVLRTHDSKWSGTLFWEGPKGQVFKVPNVWYHHIGGRTITQWVF